MFGVSFVGVGIALALVAIATFFVMPKLRAHKPKRPEPWEKAAIMKQLLARSEGEANLAATSPSARSRASASGPSNAQLRTTAKTTLAMRSKTG
jgi:hypothetical protein